MSEMKPCRCCGVKQSGVDEHNEEYESLVNMVLQSGDEKQLVALIGLMQGKICTQVTTSEGRNLLAYRSRELYHVRVIHEAAGLLYSKLVNRG